ncbi:MAG: energy transducer TonB [Spirochaetales bacterium]|nr:energy transducer TonB [Spirochaetales bacterium]
MHQSSERENERLAVGIISAAVLHAVIFLILFLFLGDIVPETPEYEGPIYIELDSMFTTTPTVQTDTTTTNTAPDSGPVENTQPKSGPKNNNTNAASANNTAPRTEETKPDSNLEEGSLSRLDEMLKNRDTSGGNNSSDDSASSPNPASSSSSSWEDNASRQPISRVEPDIPRWVSEQGLRLRVELSVQLDASGFVRVTGIKKSCGYPDVDSAVRTAVNRWKYTRVSGTATIRGTIVYVITPR